MGMFETAMRMDAEEKEMRRRGYVPASEPPDNNGWRPISSFDNRAFSIMTDGTPDCTEVVKYKGHIPVWASWWRPLGPMPTETP